MCRSHQGVTQAAETPALPNFAGAVKASLKGGKGQGTVADLRVGELGDIIHAATILLPLGSEVQHLVAFHMGLALQPNIAQMVGHFEGVWRCVHAMSFLTLCRRCTLRRTAVCLLLSLHSSPCGFSLLGWVGELFMTSVKHT